jgi:endoglucanase
MELLKKLSEMPGAPGREEHVRGFIRERVSEHVDDLEVDNLGNLICRKAPAEGADDPKRVMVACHMDEIAFYVRHIHDNGFIRLQHLGGFDVRNLFARRVEIETRSGERIPGNLNASGRPVHIASSEEKEKLPEIKELFVDTGLDAEVVKEKVRPGDPVTLVQEFIEMGDKASGKSLDNRVACWTGIRLLERLESGPCEVFVVFTAQEEIGVRGATTSSFGIDPDVGIAIDTTLAVDIPDVPEEEHVTTLGEGTAIKIFDSYSVSHRDLVDTFIHLAESKGINHQFELLPSGGTDAGALQRARDGSKVITLSVPTRYIHTVTETIHQHDLHATVDLLEAYLTGGS